MLKRPLYILSEEYRGQRQTFQSDIGIRCGDIGLSKISQGEHARARAFAGHKKRFAPPARGKPVVIRRVYGDKVSRCPVRTPPNYRQFFSLRVYIDMRM